MNVYFVGGEDIDFNAGANPPSVNTTAGYFRSVARESVLCSILQSASLSNPFQAGGLTSFWLHAQLAYNSSGTSGLRLLGAVLSSSGNKGLWIGTGSGSSTEKIAIYKYDGTTMTQLGVTPTDIWLGNAPIIAQVDLQVTNYGASANIILYVNSIAVIALIGVNAAVSGVSNLDCVAVSRGGNNMGVSEVFVGDSDTRAIQVASTLALTSNGTTSGWTNNTFSNINGTSYSDANPTYVNTTGTDQQYNITDPTPAAYSVICVKQSARMAVSAGATATAVKLGYNSGGTVAFGTGSTKTLTTSYATYEQIDTVNPVTGVAFAQSEMNALQLNMRSA